MNRTDTALLPALACSAAALGLAAAPLAAQAPVKTAAPGERIEVQMKTADGKDAGNVTFEQAEHGVLVIAHLKNLARGPHGFHIHETGRCAPDFKAAGSHYDPVGSEHGFDAAGGYHVGDLPNVHVGMDGTATTEFFVPQVSLSGPENDRYPYTLADADGSAIMVHASGDDYVRMESAGDRVACGVIAAPKG
ncbi:MAG: superoxide dismutase family protein [Porphyrobacter sp.]|nr:superoxide dismutase family protein [Porphyrobacter sp.]